MRNGKNKKYAQFLAFALSFSALIHPIYAMDGSEIFNADNGAGIKIISFLDEPSLGRAAQVSRRWKELVRFARQEQGRYRPSILTGTLLKNKLREVLQAEPDILTSLLSPLKNAPFFDEVFLKSQSLKILPKDLLDATERESFTLNQHADHPYLKTFTEVIKKLQTYPHQNQDLEKLTQKYHKILQSLLGQYKELLTTRQILYQQAWTEIDSPSEETQNLVSAIEDLPFVKDIFPTTKIYRCYADEIVQLLEKSWNRPNSAAFFLVPLDQILGKLENILGEKSYKEYEISLQALIQYYKDFKKDILRLSPKDATRYLKRSRIRIDVSQPWLMNEEKLEEVFSISSTGDLIFDELILGSSWVKPYPKENPQLYFKYHNFKDFLDYKKSSLFHPGMERAMYSLSQILGAEGIIPSLFLIVTKNEKMQDLSESILRKKRNLANPATGEPERKRIEKELEDFSWKPHRYGIQVTPAVQGRSLAACLKDNPHFKLDSKSYSRQILFGLIAKPADYKGDNLFVNQFGEIIGIDNDEALASMIVQGKDTAMTEFKNILFCLPQMQDFIHEDVITSFQALVPEVAVIQWLGSLRRQNTRYAGLFRDQDISPDLQKALHLPLYLHHQTIPQMLHDLRKLKGLLKGGITHQQVFQEMFPATSAYYAALVKEQGILKAWETIYGGAAHQGNAKSFKEVVPSVEQTLDKTSLPDINAYRHRTLLPEEAAKAMLGEIDLMALLPDELNRFLTTTIKNFGDIIRTSPPSALHESWSRDGLILKAIAAKVPESILQFLLEKGLEGSVTDHNQKTALHYVVESNVSASFLNLLSKHYKAHDVFAWLNMKDKKGTTALDIALQNQQLEYFKQLIDLGASTCDPEIALKFYNTIIKMRKDSSLKTFFIQLMGKNDEVKWQICLEEMLPPRQSSQRDTPFLTSKFKTRYLPLEIKNQILTSENQWIPYIQEGDSNHTVCRAAFEDHALYFKVYPEFSGIEEAVGVLTRKILGYGAPHTELASINGVPVLISHSHGDKTKTLDYVLRHSPELLEDLDEESLAGLILVAMLINPEDGKPSNYVIEEHPTKHGKYRIVGIDNDHAFVPVIVMEEPKKEFISQKPIPIAQVKTILYCLDQMKKPVPSSIKDLFIKLVPDTLLEEWLKGLKTCHKNYDQALFPDPHTSPEEKTKFLNDLVDQHGCVMGVSFQKTAIAHLYDKFLALRDALSGPPITPIELLRKLEPRLAKRYDLALDQLPNVKQRWDQGDALFYETHKKGYYTTVTRTGDVLKSMDIPEKESLFESIRKGKANGPEQALEELQKIKEELQTKILEELGARTGDLNILKILRLESTRAKFLEKKDFENVPLQEQEAILAYLKDKALRELFLKNCIAMNDTVLTQRLPLGYLKKCDLRGCENITSQGLLYLSQTASELEELNLSHIKSLKEIGDMGAFRADRPLIFKELLFLILNNTVNLAKLLIQAPKLYFLDVENCTLLTDQMLDGVIESSKASLQYLNLNQTDIRSLVLDAPQLKKLKMKGCKALEEIKLTTHTLTYIDIRNSESLRDFGLIDFLKGVRSLKECLIGDKYGIIPFKRIENLSFNQLNFLINKFPDIQFDMEFLDFYVQFIYPLLSPKNLMKKQDIYFSQIDGPNDGFSCKRILALLSDCSYLEIGNQYYLDGWRFYYLSLALMQLGLKDGWYLKVNINHSKFTSLCCSLALWSLVEKGENAGMSSFIVSTSGRMRSIIRDSSGNYLRLLFDNQSAKVLGEIFLKYFNNLTTIEFTSDITTTPKGVATFRQFIPYMENLKAFLIHIEKGQIDLLKSHVALITLPLENEHLKEFREFRDLCHKAMTNNDAEVQHRIGELYYSGKSTLAFLKILESKGKELTIRGLAGTHPPVLIFFEIALKFNKNLTSLTELDLRWNDIHDAGAQSLANGNLSNLTMLDLRDNNIGDEGAQSLANGTLTNLTKLDLGFNKIGPPGAQALATGNIKNLMMLTLNYNDIGDAGVQALAARNLTNLTELNLRKNKIGPVGAQALGNGNLTALSVLDLYGNNIGDIGMKNLATTNLIALTQLNLSYNQISDIGLRVLATGNLINLSSLWFNENKIGDAGVLSLVTGSLPALTRLWLRPEEFDAISLTTKTVLERRYPNAEIHFDYQ